MLNSGHPNPQGDQVIDKNGVNVCFELIKGAWKARMPRRKLYHMKPLLLLQDHHLVRSAI